VQPCLSRVLTIVAAAVLAFDGTALAALGWWSGRVLLMLVGLICFVSAGLVLLYWRWYRRRLEDIAQLRRGVSEESRELRRLLSEN
jgi:membrane protein implicated in regulation of membrane protease activity